MKEKFIELLRSTNREGIEKLIDFLDRTDFYTAPASTRFHNSFESGLLFTVFLFIYYNLMFMIFLLHLRCFLS